MKGKIESGQLCTVEPILQFETLVKSDIILCKVNGNDYLHLIKAIQGPRYQIGNNKGRIKMDGSGSIQFSESLYKLKTNS